MNTQPVVVPPWTDLRHFVEDFVYRYHRKAFPVGRRRPSAGLRQHAAWWPAAARRVGGATVADVMERNSGGQHRGRLTTQPRALGQDAAQPA